MKNFLKFSVLTAILAFAIAGCSKDNPDNPDDNGNNGNHENNDNNGNNGNNNNKPVVMQTVALKGVVSDIYGSPLSGVNVSTGTLNVTTNSKGEFNFSQAQVVDKRAVIKFEKSGYFDLTRSGLKENEMFIEAVMYPKGNSKISVQTAFDATKGATLEASGMKVKLQASSIVGADGSAYSGNVDANMLYLDPNNKDFAAMMPGGDLAGIRTNGSESVLVSYGMINVTLTDNAGKPLQLKSGSPADVTFPIPEGMENNAPPTMPLWSFDEHKGIWIEEGVATLQDGVYVGQITHFSWANLDDPKERVTLKGKVIDCNNKAVPFVKVSAEQTATYTNSKGEWSVVVPEYTPVTVSVTANGGSDSERVPGQPGGTTYTVRDLRVPCGSGGDDDGSELGTYTETEKGSIKYLMSGGNTIWVITFDNNGKRFRWDMLDANENPETQMTYTINHFTKTLWYGWGGTWYDDKYDPKTKPEVPFAIDEKDLSGFQQIDNMTIAGKSCNVYRFAMEGYDYELIYAVWNGMMMLYEINGETIWVALAATLDVPEVAFTKTFNISWLPK